MSEQQHTYA